MKVEIFEMFSGAGTLTRALSDGLKNHVEVEVSGCVELDPRYLKRWSEAHPEASTFGGSCGLYHPTEVSIAKQAAVRIAVFGIPCTGASLSGISKNGLSCAEEHEHVGHLFLYVAHWIRVHRPDFVVFENVPPFAKTFSARALRAALQVSGYSIDERVVDPYAEFDTATQRKRWVLVASAASTFRWIYEAKPFTGTLDSLLDPVSEKDRDEQFSPEQVAAHTRYCERKAREGCGFARRILTRESAKCPTIPKTYGKIQPTSVFTTSGTATDSYRMLRPREVARIHGFPDDFALPPTKTQAYEVLGQGVVYKPFYSLGDAIGEAVTHSSFIPVERGQLEFALA